MIIPDQSDIWIRTCKEALEHEEGEHVDSDLGMVEVPADVLFSLGEQDLPLYALIFVRMIFTRRLEPDWNNVASQ